MWRRTRHTSPSLLPSLLLAIVLVSALVHSGTTSSLRSGEPTHHRSARRLQPGFTLPAGIVGTPVSAAEAARRRLGRLSACRLKFEVPRSSWLFTVSVSDPECRVEVTDRLLLPSQRILTEAYLHTPRGRPDATLIARLRTVYAVNVLPAGPSTTFVQVIHRTPEMVSICCRLHLLPRCPFWVANGVTTWTIVGELPNLRQFLDKVSSMVLSYKIEAIVPAAPGPSPPVLTPRQGEILSCAFEEGYFEVPRAISLTGLALRLGLSKSTLSRTLAVAELRVLRAAALSLPPPDLPHPTGSLAPLSPRPPSATAWPATRRVQAGSSEKFHFSG